MVPDGLLHTVTMINEPGHGDAGAREPWAGDDEWADAAAADVLDSAATTPRRPRARLLSAVSVVATAAVVAAVLLVSKYLNSPLSPAAFVTQSAQRTLGERTADMILSGTLSAANQHVPVHGTGSISFATGAVELNLSASAAGQTLTEREIEVGGAFYVAITIDGTSIPRNDGGRPWIQMPLRQSGAAHVDGSDPSSMLSVLAQNGNKVRTLGTKVIAGTTCTGYAVTTGKSAVIAGAKTALAVSGVPAGVASGELKAIENMQPPVYTVWFSAQGLLRRMSVRLQTASAPASGMDVNLVLDFTDYGAPVHITAPASSETISYASLQRLEGGNG